MHGVRNSPVGGGPANENNAAGNDCGYFQVYQCHRFEYSLCNGMRGDTCERRGGMRKDEVSDLGLENGGSGLGGLRMQKLGGGDGRNARARFREDAPQLL